MSLTSLKNIKRHNGSSWVDILPNNILSTVTLKVDTNEVMYCKDSNNVTKRVYKLDCSAGYFWKPSMIVIFTDPDKAANQTIHCCTFSIYSNMTYFYVADYDIQAGTVNGGFIRVDGSTCRIEQGTVIAPVSRAGSYIVQLYGNSTDLH